MKTHHKFEMEDKSAIGTRLGADKKETDAQQCATVATPLPETWDAVVIKLCP